MDVRGSLSRSELETFLETTTVPVRLACHRPDGSLWMLSLWFRYREETIECATAASADVVAFLERDPAVAFEVSTNDPPYRGVRGNGTATVASDPEKTVLRDLLERYLGTTDAPLARRLLSDDRDEVTISIDPETVYGWDYSGRMAGSEQ
ncbi:pyridoxamine 5'-phosphate oxidase family protein [Natribaculum luteum]|uniref:Pyridoxamine 5'-phosphate oxidase family protein n=1 Tax=Natribaculum luteum TaxID=1586232 RepID=A0ABD5NX27_9EURY|nr:pyridoxamine 5'-phosphate oxidase family protein [Natribaculum luteum]